MMRRIAVGMLAGSLAACGGSVPDNSGATAAQLAAYQSVGQGLATAVQTYSVQASATTSQDACLAAQHQYDAAATPLVDRMREQSRDMDQHMDGLGSHDAADLGCVAAAMATELAHHRTEACAGTDPAADHAEALHHAETMVQWLEHQRVRYEDLAAMSGMMQARTESTFTCQANADGTYTFTQGGTQTHYPDPEHTADPSTGTGTTGTCPVPTTWPSTCQGMTCHPESSGMH